MEAIKNTRDLKFRLTIFGLLSAGVLLSEVSSVFPLEISISISPFALLLFPTSPTPRYPNLSKRPTDVLLLQKNMVNGNKSGKS